VIVGLWAVYLVPMWLRRQDELAESGSQDRIFTAMRVLTRRPVGSTAYEEIRAQEASAARKAARAARAERAKAANAARAKAARTARAADGTRPPRRRATVLARRRRVISVLFLTFTAGSGLSAGLGTLWLWLPATSGVLLSLYIMYLRAQERRRAEQRLRRVNRATAAYRAAGAEPTGRAHAPDRRRRAGAAGGHGHDPHAWEPVPVPLPTYVTAPVAPHGQTWTYEQQLAEAERAAEAAAAAGAAEAGPAGRGGTGASGARVYDQYTDLEDRPRAVND
jgi:hypothetical protein